MDETTFWRMIEQAKADSGGNGEEQVKLLAERLSLLEIGEIVEFDNLLTQYRFAAYRRDVWQAGDIAHWSGLSDDGFIDFRGWLIAQGQNAYEMVLSKPDSLAQIVTLIESDDELNASANICLEKMNYVARYAYRAKTDNGGEMPRTNIAPPVIQGAWSSKEELPQKYPQLWALFGDDAE